MAMNRYGSRTGLSLGVKLVLGAFAAILVILIYAWIDGGEEPLRQISQPINVELPASQGEPS